LEHAAELHFDFNILTELINLCTEASLVRITEELLERKVAAPV
jgi:hypothetical protein